MEKGVIYYCCVLTVLFRCRWHTHPVSTPHSWNIGMPWNGGEDNGKASIDTKLYILRGGTATNLARQAAASPWGRCCHPAPQLRLSWASEILGEWTKMVQMVHGRSSLSHRVLPVIFSHPTAMEGVGNVHMDPKCMILCWIWAFSDSDHADSVCKPTPLWGLVRLCITSKDCFSSFNPPKWPKPTWSFQKESFIIVLWYYFIFLLSKNAYFITLDIWFHKKSFWIIFGLQLQ